MPIIIAELEALFLGDTTSLDAAAGRAQNAMRATAAEATRAGDEVNQAFDFASAGNRAAASITSVTRQIETLTERIQRIQSENASITPTVNIAPALAKLTEYRAALDQLQTQKWTPLTQSAFTGIQAQFAEVQQAADRFFEDVRQKAKASADNTAILAALEREDAAYRKASTTVRGLIDEYNRLHAAQLAIENTPSTLLRGVDTAGLTRSLTQAQGALSATVFGPQTSSAYKAGITEIQGALRQLVSDQKAAESEIQAALQGELRERELVVRQEMAAEREKSAQIAAAARNEARQVTASERIMAAQAVTSARAMAAGQAEAMAAAARDSEARWATAGAAMNGVARALGVAWEGAGRVIGTEARLAVSAWEGASRTITTLWDRVRRTLMAPIRMTIEGAGGVAGGILGGAKNLLTGGGGGGGGIGQIAAGVGLGNIATQALMQVPMYFSQGAQALIGYNTQLQNLITNTGANTQLAKEFDTATRGVSAAMGLSTTSILDAERHISDFGYKGSENLKILDVASKSAVASGGDVAAQAQILASTLKQQGESSLFATSTMNLLTVGAQRGNETLEQFAENTQKVTAVGAIMNLPLSQTVGALAALTTGGFDYANSQTALINVMTHMTHVTVAQHDELVRIQKKTGIDLPQAFTSFGLAQNGLTGNFDKLNAALKAMHLAPAAYQSELQLLMNAQRGELPLIDLLVHAQGDYKANVEALQKAFESGTQTEDNYARTQNTVGQQMQDLGGKIQQIGQKFMDAAQGPMVAFLKNLNAIAATALTGNWGAALYATVTLIGQAIADLGTKFAPVNAALTFFHDHMQGTLIALSAIVASVLLPIATSIASALIPIAALGTAAVVLYTAWRDNFGGLRTFTVQVWAVIQPILAAIGPALTGIMDAFSKGGLSGALASLPTALAPLRSALSGFTDWLGSEVVGWATAIRDWVAPQIPAVVAALGTWVGAAVGALAAWGTWLADEIPTWVAALVDWVTPLIPGIAKQLEAWGTAAATTLSNFWAWLSLEAPLWASALLDWVTPVIPGIVEKLVEWGTAVVTTLAAWATVAFAAFLAGIAEALGFTWVDSAQQQVPGSLNMFGTTVSKWTDDNQQKFVNLFKKLGTAVINGMIIGINDALPGLLDGITKVADAIFEVGAAIGRYILGLGLFLTSALDPGNIKARLAAADAAAEAGRPITVVRNILKNAGAIPAAPTTSGGSSFGPSGTQPLPTSLPTPTVAPIGNPFAGGGTAPGVPTPSLPAPGTAGFDPFKDMVAKIQDWFKSLAPPPPPAGEHDASAQSLIQQAKDAEAARQKELKAQRDLYNSLFQGDQPPDPGAGGKPKKPKAPPTAQQLEVEARRVIDALGQGLQGTAVESQKTLAQVFDPLLDVIHTKVPPALQFIVDDFKRWTGEVVAGTLTQAQAHAGMLKDLDRVKNLHNQEWTIMAQNAIDSADIQNAKVDASIAHQHQAVIGGLEKIAEDSQKKNANIGDSWVAMLDLRDQATKAGMTAVADTMNQYSNQIVGGQITTETDLHDKIRGMLEKFASGTNIMEAQWAKARLQELKDSDDAILAEHKRLDDELLAKAAALKAKQSDMLASVVTLADKASDPKTTKGDLMQFILGEADKAGDAKLPTVQQKFLDWFDRIRDGGIVSTQEMVTQETAWYAALAETGDRYGQTMLQQLRDNNAERARIEKKAYDDMLAAEQTHQTEKAKIRLDYAKAVASGASSLETSLIGGTVSAPEAESTLLDLADQAGRAGLGRLAGAFTQHANMIRDGVEGALSGLPDWLQAMLTSGVLKLDPALSLLVDKLRIAGTKAKEAMLEQMRQSAEGLATSLSGVATKMLTPSTSLLDTLASLVPLIKQATDAGFKDIAAGIQADLTAGGAVGGKALYDQIMGWLQELIANGGPELQIFARLAAQNLANAQVLAGYQARVDSATLAEQAEARSLQVLQTRLSDLQYAYQQAQTAGDKYFHATLTGETAVADAAKSFTYAQRAIQNQIDQAELGGAATDSPYILALQKQLEQLRLKADLTAGQAQLQYGPEHDRLDKLANPIKEMTFAEAESGAVKYRAILDKLKPEIDRLTGAVRAQELADRAARDTVAALTLALETERRALEAVGAALPGGLAAGMQDGQGGAVNAATDTVTAVSHAFAKGWGIESPSKVTYGYALDLLQGLTNGMTDATGRGAVAQAWGVIITDTTTRFDAESAYKDPKTLTGHWGSLLALMERLVHGENGLDANLKVDFETMMTNLSNAISASGARPAWQSLIFGMRDDTTNAVSVMIAALQRLIDKAKEAGGITPPTGTTPPPAPSPGAPSPTPPGVGKTAVGLPGTTHYHNYTAPSRIVVEINGGNGDEKRRAAEGTLSALTAHLTGQGVRP